MLLLNKRFQLLYLIATVLLFSVTCKVLQAGLPSKRASNKVENLFFTYDFTLEKKSVKQRVRFLDSLGYQGVTFPVNTLKDIDKIIEYQKFVKSETNNRLKIPAVFFSYNPETKKDSATWKNIADQLAGTRTDIWVIVGAGKTASFQREEVVRFFKGIADYCEPLHLKVVIYPHDKTYIQSAAESIPYIKEVHRENLFTSFHLCHELRAGNGARMNDAIAEAAPYIRLASICGANIQMDDNRTPGYWDDAIKPLFKGDYNTSLFLEYLVRNGFKGPVALHTFGLKEPVDEHFSKSLETWRKMSAGVSEKLSRLKSIKVKQKAGKNKL
jgi:sugar phosphate isomerase/epimerase